MTQHALDTRPDPDFQAWLSASQAAAVSGVTRATMNLWIHSGSIDVKRLGKFWFVHRESLRRYLSTRSSRKASLNRKG